MQLTNKVGVSNAKAATSSARVAAPVVARQVRRSSVVVKAAAAATAPVIADNATVDKCVNAVRFLAIGTFFLLQGGGGEQEGALSLSLFVRSRAERTQLPMTPRAPAPDGSHPRPWHAASGAARREEEQERETGVWDRAGSSNSRFPEGGRINALCSLRRPLCAPFSSACGPWHCART